MFRFSCGSFDKSKMCTRGLIKFDDELTEFRIENVSGSTLFCQQTTNHAAICYRLIKLPYVLGKAVAVTQIFPTRMRYDTHQRMESRSSFGRIRQGLQQMNYCNCEAAFENKNTTTTTI